MFDIIVEKLNVLIKFLSKSFTLFEDKNSLSFGTTNNYQNSNELIRIESQESIESIYGSTSSMNSTYLSIIINDDNNIKNNNLNKECNTTNACLNIKTRSILTKTKIDKLYL